MAQSFREFLIERRKSLKMSCNQLADSADVSQSLLSKIELGKRHPTDAVLEKLAGPLGLTFDVLKARADADALGEGGFRRIRRHAPEMITPWPVPSSAKYPATDEEEDLLRRAISLFGLTGDVQNSDLYDLPYEDHRRIGAFEVLLELVDVAERHAARMNDGTNA